MRKQVHPQNYNELFERIEAMPPSLFRRDGSDAEVRKRGELPPKPQAADGLEPASEEEMLLVLHLHLAPKENHGEQGELHQKDAPPPASGGHQRPNVILILKSAE